MKTTKLYLTKDGLNAVHLCGAMLMFYYRDGAVVRVTFTSRVAAGKFYYGENWLYPERGLDDLVAHMWNVVEVHRDYQK